MKKYLFTLLLLLASTLSMFAQDLKYEDVLDAFFVKELPQKQEIESYQAIDGKIYAIGDVVEIGNPSMTVFGGFTCYRYVRGTTKFNSGQLNIYDAKIESFFVKKGVDIATAIKESVDIAAKKVVSEATQQGNLMNISTSPIEVSQEDYRKGVPIVHAILRADKTKLFVSLDNALMTNEIISKK